MSTSTVPALLDRGPAKYFHGRKQILSDFQGLIAYATQEKSGTVFLIQGAPGAGKTALLAECERLAKKKGWKTAEIDTPALWSPEILRHALGRKKIPKIVSGSIQIGVKDIAHAELNIEWTQLTILKLLQSTRKPLLLKLDEAQTLGTVNAPPPGQDGITANVLKKIHNGAVNHPVILIVGGLGTTADAFGVLGISRFVSGCLVELGALEKEAERSVLRDWFTKDGKAKGDPAAWIDAIAQETHGWPQHILSYVEPALDQLRADKRVMNAGGLNTVLEAGRIGRVAYYKQRVGSFRGDQIRCLARSIAGITPGKPIEYGHIMSSLVAEYGDNEEKKLFQRFLEKGILTKCGIGYIIPIPSMHNWLVNEFACIQTKS